MAPVEALFETPKYPYTEALLSAVPTLESEARREEIILDGDVPSPLRVPSVSALSRRCPASETGTTRRAASTHRPRATARRGR
jgi:oligopeptide transport system ATP-binding protein